MGWLKNRKLKSDDYSIRWKAVKDLGVEGNESAIETLRAMMRDDESFVREGVADALQEINGPHVIGPLVELLSDSDCQVRGEAAQALGRIEATSAVDDIIDLLEDATGEYIYTYKEALTEIKRGWKRKPAARNLAQNLIQDLADSDEAVRLNALEILDGMAEGNATKALLGLLDDPNEEIRTRAIDILGQAGDEQANDAMLGVLINGTAATRPAAIKILERIGDQRAIRPIIDFIQSNPMKDGEAWNDPTALQHVDKTPCKAIETLNRILRRTAEQAGAKDLQEVLTLEDYTVSFRINYDSPAYGDGADDYDFEMDFSSCRELAQAALDKR